MNTTPDGLHTPRNGTGDVLELLLDRNPWTRAELARASGLSRATIVSRLDALRDAGLIRDVGHLSPEGGRPTSRIALNPKVRTVAAIELSHSSCQITLADLGAHPILQTTVPLSLSDDYESTLRAIATSLRELLDGLGEDHGALGSVTLGVPMSATSNAVGLLRESGSRGWMGFPVREWLESELAVTVHVENDVNLMALGERIASFPDSKNLLLVHAADGIGTGVIADGHLVRGARGLAGEIAHVPTPRHHSRPCLCGNVGCLAAVATISAVLLALREEGVDATSLEDLMQLVTRGDVTAARVLREAGRHVGEVLSYSISSTNPEVLVVSGNLAFAGDYLVAGIRESLHGRGSTALTENLLAIRSSNPSGEGTRGALQLSAEHILTDGSLLALLENPSS